MGRNCDLVVGRLIALDKHQEVRLVGVGETLLQLMVKCTLGVAGQEAKVACGTKQLTGGVDACIEGGIHGMHLLWVQNSQEEDWGLLLIDEQNEFNEDRRTAMLWDVWHEWPSSANFTFNFYCHWSTLVVRNSVGSCQFLHRKEDATQGDPLAMIIMEYGCPLSSESSGTNTPVLHSHGMLMIQGQGEVLATYWPTYRISRRGGHRRANSWSRERAAWS